MANSKHTSTSTRSRVLVTLDPETRAVVDELAELGGVAVASLLGGLIKDSRPALEALIKALKMAKEKNADAFDELSRMIAGAQSEAAQLQIDVLEEKKRLRRERSDSKK